MDSRIAERLEDEDRALAVSMQSDEMRHSLRVRKDEVHWRESGGTCSVLFPFVRLRCCGRHETWREARTFDFIDIGADFTALRDALESAISTRLGMQTIRALGRSTIDPFIPLLDDGKVFIGDVPETGHVRRNGTVIPKAQLELRRMLHEIGHLFLHRSVRDATDDHEWENDTVGDLFLYWRGLITRRVTPMLIDTDFAIDDVIASRRRILVAMHRFEDLLPSPGQMHLWDLLEEKATG